MKAFLISICTLFFTLHYSSNLLADTDSSSESSQVVMAPININTATTEEIAATLKGVGVKKAEAIVALRDSLGGFKRVEQLLDVKGIGEATLEKNKALIRVE